jgi:hypothetical protein
MTDKQTPPDWVLLEAAKRSRWKDDDVLLLRHAYLDEINGAGFTALCDMIERYEKPPVDRKLLCAREAVARLYVGEPEEADIRYGHRDEYDHVVCSKRAIELYEGGFGK